MSKKPGWQTVQFGEVVKLNKERVADPATEGIELYVGIEHIKPEDLRIRSWGLVAEGTTFTNYFRPGQVLFVKRRAYQRKVALADISGVCSGDIYVLESRDSQVLLPELLPFICQTDGFFNHAVGTSAGSLSPRTNWKQLANYEFALPPLEEQRRIAKLLASADVMIEAQETALDKLMTLKQSSLRETYLMYQDKFRRKQIGDIGKWETGRTPSKKKKEYWEAGSIPWVTPKDVKTSSIEDTRDHVTETAIEQTKSTLLEPGSFVVVWRSGILRHTLPVARVQQSYTINQDMKAFKPANAEIMSEYVRYFLEAFSEEIRLRCVKSGTTVESIDSSAYYRYLIPIPPVTTQEELIRVASQFDNSIACTRSRLQSDKELKSRMLDVLD